MKQDLFRGRNEDTITYPLAAYDDITAYPGGAQEGGGFSTRIAGLRTGRQTVPAETSTAS